MNRALPKEPPASAPQPLADAPQRTRYPNLMGCVDNGVPRAPCPHTACRYHLAQRGPWEHATSPTRDCAIDVANEGPHTLEEVATFIGLSEERVRQLEERALELLAHDITMKGLHNESTE